MALMTLTLNPDADYNVQIRVSGLNEGFSLLPIPEDYLTDPAVNASPTTTKGSPGYVTLKYSGSVDFVSSSHHTEIEGTLTDGVLRSTNGVVTIDIQRMDEGDTLTLSYENVWFDEAVTAADGLVSVTVNSDSERDFATAMLKGEVAVKPGSGTIKFEDPVAQINTRKDITITYTADTLIANAYLVVKIPDGAFKMPNAQAKDDTDFIPLTLTFGSKYPDVLHSVG